MQWRRKISLHCAFFIPRSQFASGKVNRVEELLAYAYLIRAGFHFEEALAKRIDELYMAHPDDRDLAELEWISGDLKETLYYIFARVNNDDIDREKFGKALMELIKPFYQSMEIHDFAKASGLLGSYLPADLYDEKPFCYLHFANEPLAWDDVKQTRKLYGEMLNYYEN